MIMMYLKFESIMPGDLSIVMQVGFGLMMDLWAIASGLGGEGGSCISVVEPVVDVATVHRSLYARSVPGIAKVCMNEVACVALQA
jgi:hypothetical protein